MLCLVYGTYATSAISAIGYIAYIAINISFSIVFDKKIAQTDELVKYWASLHPRVAKGILTLSGIFSFKMMRLHYSFLFGHDVFKCKF